LGMAAGEQKKHQQNETGEPYHGLTINQGAHGDNTDTPNSELREK
jgi:hypothetical protein